MESQSSAKVALFTWTTALWKILTIDNLRRIIINVDWCCTRKKVGESMDNMLFHCPLPRDLWSFFLGGGGYNGYAKEDHGAAGLLDVALW